MMISEFFFKMLIDNILDFKVSIAHIEMIQNHFTERLKAVKIIFFEI